MHAFYLLQQETTTVLLFGQNQLKIDLACNL